MCEFLFDDRAGRGFVSGGVAADSDLALMELVDLFEMEIVDLSAAVAGCIGLGDPLVEEPVEVGMVAGGHVGLELGVGGVEDG